MKLTMVGTGYVGLVTGACFSNTGNDVTCLDVDATKIGLLNEGSIPIHEPGLSELIRRNTHGGRLSFTTDRKKAYADAEAIFISVGTNAGEDGSPDLRAVFQAAEDIAEALEAGGPRSVSPLVVVKSTVPVGTTHRVRDLMRGRTSKPFHNMMLACKVSFINEIANLCEYHGADIGAVREGMCPDHRIGNQFLYPGLGFGGSCFPKDVQAVINMGKTVGFDCKLAGAVYEVNRDQRLYFWNKIVEHFGQDLRGRTLAFWGIAFKPETDDIREAPSMSLMAKALAANAAVRAFDPVAAERLNEQMPEVTTVGDMYEVLVDCDALVICTEWSEFRHPDFNRMARAMKGNVIFDGRNIYRPETMQRLGFVYYSVGREPVHHGTDRGGVKRPAARQGA
jgi:UDPglucose 6-dehydrogenase